MVSINAKRWPLIELGGSFVDAASILKRKLDNDAQVKLNSKAYG